MRNSETFQAVCRGAEVFDEKIPDWFNRIDIPSLRMQSLVTCCLGQLYGTYATGLEVLRLSAYDAQRHGFVAGNSGDEYEELKKHWIAAIKVRRRIYWMKRGIELRGTKQ